MRGVDTAADLEEFFRVAGSDYGGRDGSVRRRLRAPHGVDVFAEVRLPEGERALLVMTNEPRPDDTLVVTAGVSCRVRGGNVEVVGASGADLRLLSVLLFDLVTQLRSRGGSPSGILVDRINAWRRMLGRGLWRGMTPQVSVGLFGELIVLRELLLPTLGKEAVRAWCGPSGSSKDFVYGGVGVEVKTVSPVTGAVCRINNEHQLDGVGLRRVHLIHQTVDRGANGETLAHVIDGLRSDSRLGAVRDEFEDGLLEAGWVEEDRRFLEEDRYSLIDRTCYLVSDGFPRLVPDDLASGVSGVSYLIDLSVCRPHIVGEEDVLSAVTPSDTLVKEQ